MEKSGMVGTQAGAVMAVFGGLTLNELLAVGASYTATEQAMLNAVKTLVNQLRTDLVAAGVIKGAA